MNFIGVDVSLVGTLKCLIGNNANYYLHIVAITLCPLILICGLGLHYLLRRKSISRGGRLYAFRNKHQAYFILIAFVMLPATSKAVFRSYVCRRFDDGIRKMTADYSLNCDVRSYNFMVAYATIMVCIWPIGMPLVFYVLLYSSKNDLQRDEHFTSKVVDPLRRVKKKPFFSRATFSDFFKWRHGKSSPCDSDYNSVEEKHCSTIFDAGDTIVETSGHRASIIGSKYHRSRKQIFESRESTIMVLSVHIRDYLEDKQICMKELFGLWDNDQNDRLTKDEFRRALFLINLSTNDSELDRFFHILDGANKAYLQLDDFVTHITFNLSCNPRLSGLTMLYRSYKPDFFFWELLVTVRRITITAALVTFRQGSVEQNIVGIIVQFTSVVLQCVYNPYKADSANHTSLACEIMLFMVLFAGLILAYKEYDELRADTEIIIGPLLSTMLVGVIMVAFITIMREVLHNLLFDDVASIRAIKRAARIGRSDLAIESDMFAADSCVERRRGKCRPPSSESSNEDKVTIHVEWVTEWCST